MKKLFFGLAALFLLLLAACGASKQIDGAALAHDLVTQLHFDDELSELEPGMAQKLYGIDGAESLHAYVSSGATAEEVAVFTFSDQSGAARAADQLLAHLKSQKSAFERYIPSEVTRLNRAIIRTAHNTVVLCVCSDDRAESLLQKYLE